MVYQTRDRASRELYLSFIIDVSRVAFSESQLTSRVAHGCAHGRIGAESDAVAIYPCSSGYDASEEIWVYSKFRDGDVSEHTMSAGGHFEVPSSMHVFTP